MKKTLLISLIFIFGLFYIFSGVIKIIDVDNFLYLIRSYNINIFLYVAPAIPVIEIIVGLMFLFRIRLKNLVLFSILLLFFFTVIFSYGYFTKGVDDCGCFGGVDILKMSPVFFYIRNGLLIILSVFIYTNIQNDEISDNNLSFVHSVLIFAVILSSALIIGVRSNLKDYLRNTPYTILNINDYHEKEFLNKNIHETALSEYVTTSKDSTYIIFVFSYKCPHCIVSSHYLNEYIDNHAIDKVLGITKGTRKEEKLYSKNVKTKFDYKRIRFIEMNEITTIYPISFYVESDTIRFKIKGTLPTYDRFQELYLNKSVQTQ
jgi:hypothetical protein